MDQSDPPGLPAAEVAGFAGFELADPQATAEFLQHLRPGLMALSLLDLGTLPPAALPTVVSDE
jgi:hypothetical protein